MALTSELLRLLCPHTSLFVFFPAIVIQLKLQHFETTPPPPGNRIKSVFRDLFIPIELQTPGVVPNSTEHLKVFEQVCAGSDPPTCRH